MSTQITHPIFGIPVVENQMLVGQKKAVLVNNQLCVSPAVMALMRGATTAELEHLFRHLEIVDLGKISLTEMEPIQWLTPPSDGLKWRVRFK